MIPSGWRHGRRPLARELVSRGRLSCLQVSDGWSCLLAMTGGVAHVLVPPDRRSAERPSREVCWRWANSWIHAEAVVRGTPIQAESFWSSDRSMIYTTYRIRVDGVILGDATPVLDVTTQGGRVGRHHARGLELSRLGPGTRVSASPWRGARLPMCDRWITGRNPSPAGKDG